MYLFFHCLSPSSLQSQDFSSKFGLWFARSSARSFVRSFICSCVRAFLRLFMRSFVLSFVPLFIYKVFRSHARLFLRSIRSFIRWFDLFVHKHYQQRLFTNLVLGISFYKRHVYQKRSEYEGLVHVQLMFHFTSHGLSTANNILKRKNKTTRKYSFPLVMNGCKTPLGLSAISG